jgi:putative DNA primase/helicase
MIGAALTIPNNGYGFDISNPTEALRAAMADAGIITSDPIIPDGQLHRIHIEGHSRGSKNGAYVLHVDCYVNGWFKDFKSGFESTWSPKGGRYRLNEEDRSAIQAEQALRRAERQRDYELAAKTAKDLYGRAIQANHHPYLREKRVPACQGLRISPAGDLLVPGFDQDGVLWTVQKIFKADGGAFDKRYLKGTKVAGMSFRLAGDETIGICEGIATGISLRRETGHSIYVTFGAGNLMAVAMGLRRRFPNERIIVYADNDAKKPINTGLVKGREAARAIFGELCVPPIDGDFNDYLDSGNGH